MNEKELERAIAQAAAEIDRLVDQQFEATREKRRVMEVVDGADSDENEVMLGDAEPAVGATGGG